LTHQQHGITFISHTVWAIHHAGTNLFIEDARRSLLRSPVNNEAVMNLQLPTGLRSNDGRAPSMTRTVLPLPQI
jgi:hypothetical protein